MKEFKEKVSRRQFFNKGVKGAAMAYVAPVVLTVALNSPAEAEWDRKDDRNKRSFGDRRGKGKGDDVSEVGGKKNKYKKDKKDK